ncbi:HAMP domain-containing histidine kinase [Gillisia sp. M10.2A]|uniref:histidine kinase n=1 Tax=Gillisia lutea TaxID=2909668 RepID=A0ABS9EIQ8_9FLAO|nr:HAMP domain-containing sensor histidine kinase [Gillisia lutea]MCF4101744.1 HAMP domain-containing histidine kinase [Gillisia lutea]
MDQAFSLNHDFSSSENEGSALSDVSGNNDYDQLTFLAATICKVPLAYLSIVNAHKPWVKSAYGKDIIDVDTNNAMAQSSIMSNSEIHILNYSKDAPLLKENDSSYKFYAGIKLCNQNNEAIGVLSILDTEERHLENYQIEGLKALGNQCLKLFAFRKQNKKFKQIQQKLKQKYQELEKFASVVSHDLKSPLANIISLTELLKEENEGKLDEETVQYLNYLVESSYALRNYVDGILSFYRSEHIMEKDYENVDLPKLLAGIAHLYEVSDDVEFQYPNDITLHNVNKAALTQVFLNLVSNALKYNKKNYRKIDIKFNETPDYYKFQVIDNGDGISKDNSSKIFELFTTLDTNDRDGNPGSGIGLATVKKLVNHMHGKISLSSIPGEGSNFAFSIKRV